ncbi:MAG: acylphosphatase [Desulforegulaceae bacterium]|jgi:acylphosphatase|nr:acylphosphatase [Desulforegulaceae bacterium]
MEDKKAVHLVIKGRVQGVAFRWYSMKKAVELEVTGYVKNNSNGNVEMFIEGKEKKVDSMLKWCKTGPPSADVQEVEEKVEDFFGKYSKFEILY